MTQPEIRSFHSPDLIETDLEDYQPRDSVRFMFLLQMMIAPVGSGPEASEAFDVVVATPRWLEENLNDRHVVASWFYLTVLRYDWERIEAYLRHRVAACQGRDWSETYNLLSQFAISETRSFVDLEGFPRQRN